MYIDSAAGAILVQLLFLVAVVAVLVWLFGRVTRRR
jgi:flagellar biogenesis protein FliO